MSATYTQARDDLYGLVAEPFLSHATAAPFRVGADANNPLPGVLWDDVDGMRQRAEWEGGVAPWAHVSVKHASETQRTLNNREGERRFVRTGLVVTELFVPGGTGLRDLDPLAEALVEAVRGVRTANGVRVTNARLVEVGTSGPWFMANVIADFAYDSIG